MSRMRVLVPIVVVAAASACAPSVQPSSDGVYTALADERLGYVGTAGGGVPVRGAALVDDASCVEIAPTACLPPARGGRYCKDGVGAVDMILRDGIVLDMVCYTSGDEGPLRVSTSGGDVPTIPTDLDHRVIQLEGEVVIDADVVIEGDHVALHGEGPDRARITGDVHLRGRFARLRGVRVEGNVFVEDAQAALMFNRIHGDVVVQGGETERSVLAGNDVSGTVIVRASSPTLAANRVQGPFLIFGEDARCVDNLAFVDRDGDGEMAEQGEVLGRLGCEPNGLRYADR